MDQSEQADAVIRDHVGYSAAAAMIPVPLGDVLAITALQLDLVKSLSNIYEQDFTASLGKGLVMSLTGTSIARIAASAVKAIPGVGWAGGGAVQLALAGSTTYAIGHLFKSHFAAGGTLDTFNPEKAREMYEKYVEKGRSVVSEKGESPISAEVVADALQKLVTLREAGDLTREEYDELKAKLITRSS